MFDMRSSLRGAATLGVVVLLALAAGGGAALAGDDGDDGDSGAKLLRKHRPVLVFHPQERFRPMKVNRFVDDSELERFTGSLPQQLAVDAFWTVVDPDPEPGTLPALAPGAFYRLDQKDCEADAVLAGRDCYAAAAETGRRPAVYGRVIRTETRIVLQYWLFYYDNPLLLPPTPVGTFWQSHEGDWEVVNVILDRTGAPLEAAYSQHCSGQRRAWSSVEKSGARPVAYVALGSHANFFAPGAGALGTIPIANACIPAAVQPILPSLPFLQVADQVLDGPRETRASLHRIEGKQWSTFGGRWGESEYFSTPIPLGPVPAGAAPVGLAPASPALQSNWNASTILGWPTG